MTLPTLSNITDAAVRAAAHSLTLERGMLRVRAMQGGPGRAPPAPKPAAAYVAPPPAPPAPAAPPPKGWNANKPSSMAALDAARREREGKGRRS
jgi:hypothetical protein